jgi:hypothetical protein
MGVVARIDQRAREVCGCSDVDHTGVNQRATAAEPVVSGGVRSLKTAKATWKFAMLWHGP